MRYLPNFDRTETLRILAKSYKGEPHARAISNMLTDIAHWTECLFHLAEASNNDIIQLRFNRYLLIAACPQEGALDEVYAHLRTQVQDRSPRVKAAAEEACQLFKKIRYAINQSLQVQAIPILSFYGRLFVQLVEQKCRAEKTKLLTAQYNRLLARETVTQKKRGLDESMAQEFWSNIKKRNLLM